MYDKINKAKFSGGFFYFVHLQITGDYTAEYQLSYAKV